MFLALDQMTMINCILYKSFTSPNQFRAYYQSHSYPSAKTRQVNRDELYSSYWNL